MLVDDETVLLPVRWQPPPLRVPLRAVGTRLVGWCRFPASRWVTAVVFGCATAAGAAGQPAPHAEVDPATVRPVTAISVQTSGLDGQTSWILEPDVPRIPRVGGLHEQMPPHIQRRMSYAFDLAQRGATYSAADEFQAVLGLCALELDAREGGTAHRDALRQGLIALDEADAFSGDQLDWRESADVRSVAAGHATPVLREHAQAPVDSIQAAQAYYAYAEERLAYACQGMPGASLAFYGLGRTIVMPDGRAAHPTGKAALYHRVALIIAPQNVLAGNELGVLLARHGRLDDAQRMFQQCVAIEGTPETYRNLAAVYARKGDQRSSQAALAASEAIAAHDRSQAAAAGAAAISQSTEAASPTPPDKEQTSYLPKLRLPPPLNNIFRR